MITFMINEYPVSILKATSMESPGVIHFLLLCQYLVLTDYCYPDVVIINNKTTFLCIE